MSEHEALKYDEKRKLASCEKKIERGLTSFVEVGEALAAIRESRLYREGYANFEDYCRERWDLDRAYAYETIQASETVRALSGIPDSLVPSNPGQARALKGLEPGEAEEVMKLAADRGKVTAKSIKEARADYEGESPKPEESNLEKLTKLYLSIRDASAQIAKLAPNLNESEKTALLGDIDGLINDFTELRKHNDGTY